MNKDSSDKLYEKSKFKYREGFYGFECGDGWYFLLYDLICMLNWALGRYQEVEKIRDNFITTGRDIPIWILEYFAKHPIDPMKSFSVHQVKSKFGSLRFYVGSSKDEEIDNFINGAVSMAERFSNTVCERCGQIACEHKEKE